MDAAPKRPYDRAQMFRLCAGRILKDELLDMMASVCGEVSLPKKAKKSDIVDAYAKSLGKRNFAKLCKLYPARMGISVWDAQELFGLPIQAAQAEYLERHGKLHRVDTYIGKLGGIYALYSADSFADLMEEDLQCPAIPGRVSRKVLKTKMGWTNALIRDFLPSPMQVQNPVRRNGEDMQLWYTVDVERIMDTEEFRSAQALAQRRKKAAGHAVQTKRQKLAALVDKKIANIRVTVIPPAELIGNALKEKQDWYDAVASTCDNWMPWDAYSADSATVSRWVVNYIRHKLTNYDADLFAIQGKVGTQAEYQRYRAAVFQAIAQAYPQYAAECRRQTSH